MVTSVPIGFGDWSLDVLPSILKEPLERTIPIFGAFEVTTNPSLRQPCRDALVRNEQAVIKKTANRREF
jgi:hypothetical protein